MLVHKSRTLLAAILICVLAVRVSGRGPIGDSLTDTAADPAGAWRAALSGWDVSGQLGLASAQGLRELPFTGIFALADWVGLGWQSAQILIRAALMLLALAGALRLARTPWGAGDVAGRSWIPWFGAVSYAATPVLVGTVTGSPTDGVALAVLPWAAGALASGPSRPRAAWAGAAWTGAAGIAAPTLAIAVLLAALVVTWSAPHEGPRARRDRILWSICALASSAWWLAAAAWEWVHGPEALGLGEDGPWRAAAAILGEPGLPLWWLPLVVMAGAATALAGLAVRSPDLPSRTVTTLLALSLVIWVLPAWPGGDSPTSSLALRITCVLAVQALAGLIAWTPFWGAALAHPALRQLSPGEIARAGAVVPALALLVLSSTVSGLLVAANPKAPEAADELEAWRKISSWARAEEPTRVLVLPAARDEVQASSVARGLGHGSWVARDLEPAGTAGEQHALDRISERLMAGEGGPGTATALQRLGISHVLLRQDLPLEHDLAAPLAPARGALVLSGAELAISAGGGDQESQVDFGVRSDTASLEVWQLPRRPGLLTHPGAPLKASGGPGVAAALADAQALDERAVQLVPAADAVLGTDQGRRRDVDLARPWRPVGETLPDDAAASSVPAGARESQTATLALQGAERVRASSSAADVGTWSAMPGARPLAALDRNPFTSWRSQPGEGVGEYWEVRFDGITAVGGATVSFQQLPGMPPVTGARIEVGETSTEVTVPPEGQVQVPLAQSGDRLRVSVTALGPAPAARQGAPRLPVQVAISEVAVPGVTVTPAVALAQTPVATSWLFSVLGGNRAACVPANPAITSVVPGALPPTVCHRGLPWQGEETGDVVRSFQTGSAQRLTGRLSLVAAAGAPGALLAQELGAPQVVATATSVAAPDLAVQPQAAVDGDPGTSWRAAPGDTTVSLTLTWPQDAVVDGVELQVPDGALSAEPTRVRVSSTVGLDQEVELQEGRAAFPATRTRDLTLTFAQPATPTTFETSGWLTRPAPLSLAEIRIDGAPQADWDGTTPHRLACGSGPTVDVAGRAVQTAVTASADDLVRGHPVVADLCETVTVPQGEVMVHVPASTQWVVQEVLLAENVEAGATGAAELVGTEAADLLSGRGTQLSTPSGALQVTVAAPVPAGSGWVAEAGGERLEPVTLDGWAQGWLAPGGTEVTLRYAPASSLLLAVGAGALLWLGVVLLAALRTGRGLLKRAD